MPKVIAIDLDDVISHFVETWLYYYNIKGYDNVCKEDIVDWDITKFVKGSNKQMVMDLLKDPKIYKDARIKDNARLAIYFMQEYSDVYIVTAPGKNNCVYEPKFEWVQRNLPEFNIKRLVFLNDKHLFQADILIDDKPETIEKFREYNLNGFGYLYDNPWNRKYDYNRFLNWSQIKDFMVKYLR